MLNSQLPRPSESPSTNRELWLRLFESPRAGREAIMSPSDFAFLNAQPEVLTIYRGGNACGLSWTTEHESAVWFASRFNGPGTDAELWAAQIKRIDVLAAFSGRGESEIVCNPTDLRGLQLLGLE